MQTLIDLLVAAAIVIVALAAYAIMGEEPCRYTDTCVAWEAGGP